MTTRRFETSSEIFGLDTERILRVLSQHGVDYVLVGGLAAIAHGSTMATADADLLPRLDLQNLDRLLDALEELDAKLLASERRLALESGEIWESEELRTKGAAALTDAEAWHFTTSAGPIDIVISVTGVGRFDAHINRAEERSVFGVRIRVAAMEDLIASKQATRRPKDEAILRELQQLRTDDSG